MGRGLGAVQRRVLDLLAAERRNWTITEITTAIHGESHTDSHRRGVARAVSSLAERGLVRTMLSARRFRVVTVRRPAYVPRYLEPENGEQYGGVVVESIFGDRCRFRRWWCGCPVTAQIRPRWTRRWPRIGDST